MLEQPLLFTGCSSIQPFNWQPFSMGSMFSRRHFSKKYFWFFFFFFFLNFFFSFCYFVYFFFIFLISFFEFFTFSKLLPQKIDFLNCFIKICIFKITSSNNKKQIFKRHFQNCLRKKYIFKLLPQKRYLWNFSLKKDIFEIAPS